MSIRNVRGHDQKFRQNMMRNLATDLIMQEKLEITLAKAKKLQGYVDKLVTLGKQGTLHARRQALAILRPVDHQNNNTACKKLFDVIAKRYKDRNGGYLRILKLDNRKGDNAPMAIIQFV